MIVPKLVASNLKHPWAATAIVATVLVVAGCELPGAEYTVPPATATPAASPAAADRGSTAAARLVTRPTLTTEVYADPHTPCTTGLEPMRQYASHDVAKWTADGSYILFTYNAAVWVVTPDGSRLWRLAEAWGRTELGPGESVRAHFGPMTSFDITPDSQRVVYATCRYPPDRPRAGLAQLESRDFDYELAVVGFDEQAPRRLTRDQAFDNYPAWSPDGTRIAFVSDRGPGHWFGLYTMAADGADVRRLAADLGVVLQPPAWSPDGRSIAITGRSQGDAALGLYLVHSDGAGFVRRANDAVSGGTWSPDGTQLAFAKHEGTRVTLYTMAADGSDERHVTTVPYWQAWIHTIAWSPDGSKLLYSCGPRHFCVVTLDGEPVGETPLLEGQAVWSPDGARIAVAAKPEWPSLDEQIVLYSVAPDGSDRQTLAWRDVGLVAAQVAKEELATSRAACTEGFVVPAPDANPGLVRDCEALLAAREALFGRRLVNWGSGSPIGRWEGVTVAGTPPRVTGLGLCDWCLGPFSVGPLRLGCIPAGLKHLQDNDPGNLGWPVCEAGS